MIQTIEANGARNRHSNVMAYKDMSLRGPITSRHMATYVASGMQQNSLEDCGHRPDMKGASLALGDNSIEEAKNIIAARFSAMEVSWVTDCL